MKHKRKYNTDKIDWFALDWSKTNKELIEETHKSLVTIKSVRYVIEKPLYYFTRLPRHNGKTLNLIDIDWNRIDNDISKEYNIDSYRVAILRLRLMKECPEKNIQPSNNFGIIYERIVDINWDKVNWKRIDTKIAKELKISNVEVKNKRLELMVKYPEKGIELSKKFKKSSQQKVSQAEWDKIDWNQRDVDIARKVKVSRERVRQIRRDRGESRSEFYHQQNSSIKLRKMVRENRGNIDNVPFNLVIRYLKSNNLIDKNLAISTNRYKILRNILQKENMKWSPRFHRTQLYNWSLPSSDIAKIWHRGYQQIGSRRYNKSLPSPLWTRIFGRCNGDFHYHATIKEEKRRAAIYFKAKKENDIETIIKLYQERKVDKYSYYEKMEKIKSPAKPVQKLRWNKKKQELVIA